MLNIYHELLLSRMFSVLCSLKNLGLCFLVRRVTMTGCHGMGAHRCQGLRPTLVAPSSYLRAMPRWVTHPAFSTRLLSTTSHHHITTLHLNPVLHTPLRGLTPSPPHLTSPLDTGAPPASLHHPHVSLMSSSVLHCSL